MNYFGFMVGTLLVNTLFLYDVFVTKYQRKWSLWGSTMILIIEKEFRFAVVPVWTVISLWLLGIGIGNSYTILQIFLSIIFWIYIAVLYITTTIIYYKWKISEIKEE